MVAPEKDILALLPWSNCGTGSTRIGFGANIFYVKTKIDIKQYLFVPFLWLSNTSLLSTYTNKYLSLGPDFS
jgi:hypothetical protein